MCGKIAKLTMVFCKDTEKFLLGAKWQPKVCRGCLRREGSADTPHLKEDNIVKDMAKSGAAGSTFMQVSFCVL